jgi:hypothetical protein
MLGSISNQMHGVAHGRVAAPASGVTRSEAPENRPQPKQARGPEADAEQLKFFLGNITKADAAAVIALTQPSKTEASASFGQVASAYGDF